MNTKLNLKTLLWSALGTLSLWVVCWSAVFQFAFPVPDWLGYITEPNERFVMLLVALGVGGIGLLSVARFLWLLVSEDATCSQPTV